MYTIIIILLLFCFCIYLIMSDLLLLLNLVRHGQYRAGFAHVDPPEAKPTMIMMLFFHFSRMIKNNMFSYMMHPLFFVVLFFCVCFVFLLLHDASSFLCCFFLSLSFLFICFHDFSWFSRFFHYVSWIFKILRDVSWFLTVVHVFSWFFKICSIN